MTTFNLKDALEETNCAACTAKGYEVVYPSRYPANLSQTELVKMYQSSSDTILMDQLVRCTTCGMEYLSPRLPEKLIVESYAAGSDEVFIEENPFRVSTFYRTLDQVRNFFGGKPFQGLKVLDIGCAGGAFLKAARQHEMDATGIEPSAWLSKWGRENDGLNILTGILPSHSFPEKTFDLITYWDVIEHIANPGQDLAQVHRILKDDGCLILNFPDADSWARRVFGRRWPFFLSVHLHYFNVATISRMLSRHGFQVIHSKPYFQTLSLGYILKRAERIFSIFGIARRIVYALHMDAWPLSYHLGQTMVIARKAR